MFESKKSKKSFLLAIMMLGTVSSLTIMGLSFQNLKAIETEKVVNLPAQDTRFEVDQDGKLTKYVGTAKEVTIPSNVKTISFGAFMNRTEIEKLILPEGLETIDEYAFYSCTSLKEVNIPDSVKVINRLAFGNCENLEKVNIGKGLFLLEKFVFLGCPNLKEINVSDQNECFSSHNGIIYNKDYSELILCPMGITEKNVEIRKNTTAINSYAFLNCKNLQEVSRHGNKLISIYDAAFSGCKNLKKLNFEEKIDLIGPCAFMKCSSLKEFVIGEKVKSIGDSAFLGCKSLKKIISKSKVAEIGHKLFESCSQTILVQAIKDSKLLKYVQTHSDHLTLA